MSLELALDLYQTAEAIMRQNLRREHPDEGDEAIERRVVEWLLTRRGAERGDMVGRERPWPPERP